MIKSCLTPPDPQGCSERGTQNEISSVCPGKSLFFRPSSSCCSSIYASGISGFRSSLCSSSATSHLSSIGSEQYIVVKIPHHINVCFAQPWTDEVIGAWFQPTIDLFNQFLFLCGYHWIDALQEW